ncbi:endonuclease III [Acetobacter cibinongensis]|uniref:Endonuclease III n=2 Tax=Acetobacter cibinongensis TaxID=146475 RepID=A0A1Z5YVM3_9PROT|nr:endonuclease III [Acetobacter cibinongensis]OUJ02818.1 endonuclease III [Acetobacter cibinongensis]
MVDAPRPTRTRKTSAASTAAPKATAKRAPSKATKAAKATAPKTGPATQAPRDMKPEEIRAFLKDLAQAWPDAETELHYSSPFTLLVAVVLSAQATDASVNKVTPALFAAAPTPAAMAALGDEGVGALIRTIGLWRNKAKNVVTLSRQLLERHGGTVPGTREELEALAGVGRKTANVVLNVAFNQPTVPVDTHVFRLANRTGLGRGKTVEAVEAALERRIPKDMIRDSHHWLILQGRYVCKARKPECWRCAAMAPCLFPAKTERPVIKPPRSTSV